LINQHIAYPYIQKTYKNVSQSICRLLVSYKPTLITVIFIIHLGLCSMISIFVCLLIAARVIFSSYTTVTITDDRAVQNLDLCLAFMAFSNECSFSCQTYCGAVCRFVLSHPKDWHPHRTVGFDLRKQGSPDFCASALTSLPGSLSRE
jgi:hypothetical protein